MNMNMNLNFKLDKASLLALLPLLRKAQVYLYGLALIGIFGYTSYALNTALNVKPAATQSQIQPLPPVTFDKPTITALKQLQAVDGQVPLTNIGKDDPFR